MLAVELCARYRRNTISLPRCFCFFFSFLLPPMIYFLFSSLPLPSSSLSPSVLRVAQCLSSLSSQQSQLRRVRHQTTTAYASSSAAAAAVTASGARVAFESSGHGCRWSGGVFRDPGWRGRCILPPSSVHRYPSVCPDSRPWRAPNIRQITLMSVRRGRTDSLCRPCVMAKNGAGPKFGLRCRRWVHCL